MLQLITDRIIQKFQKNFANKVSFIKTEVSYKMVSVHYFVASPVPSYHHDHELWIRTRESFGDKNIDGLPAF